MNEEVKKELASLLQSVYNAALDDYNGDAVHPCEYYSHKRVLNVAKKLGIELEEGEEY